jgi:ABC-type multidrug transport system fused ATPase/permease subunit
MLFNDTIRANIAYSNLHATDEEIWQAAHAARAADFIEKTSLGLDTPVGEGGQALSGGERQRIAIARAFLKKAPILILDEATSSVDTPTEHLIQEAIRELVKDRTTLVIAHRPSTISLATKIVLLENGQLRKVGGHRELLEQDELYKKIYRAQFLHVAGGAG